LKKIPEFGIIGLIHLGGGTLKTWEDGQLLHLINKCRGKSRQHKAGDGTQVPARKRQCLSSLPTSGA